MARVEIPAPGDLIMDDAGNVQANVTVSLKLAGTVTDATHYSALTGGTSATGGLKSGSDGTVVDGSGNRRYVDSGVSLDMTIDGRTKQLEPVSANRVGREVIDPVDGSWGAVGSSVDSTPAIQKAINYAIMGATTDPALPSSGGSLPMTGRFAVHPIKFGPGLFRLDSKLKVYAAIGLKFQGAGSNMTRFCPGTAGQDIVLDFNGCADSYFSDFASAPDPALVGTCTDFMNVDSLSTVSRNTGENNLFHNISVGNGCKYINGVKIGANGPSNAQDTSHQTFHQVSCRGSQRIALAFTADTTNTSTTISNVSNTTNTSAGIQNGDTITGTGIPAATTVVSGAGTSTLVLSNAATATNTTIGLQRSGWDVATYWQTGFKIAGAFGSGNVLQFVFNNCQESLHVKGIHYTATNVYWRGGWLIGNATDIQFDGGIGGAPSHFDGFRGESSGRLLDTASTSVVSQLTLRNIGWNSALMNSDGFWIRWLHGGVFQMDNVQINNGIAARALQNQIRIGTSGGSQMVKIRDCAIETLTGNPEPISAWLTESGTTRRGTWVVEGISSPVIGGSAEYAAGIASDKPLAGPVSNRDRIAPIMSFPATLNSTTLLVSGSSVASAQVRIGQTISGTNIPGGTTVTAVSGNNITLSAAATGSGAITAALITYTVVGSDRYVGIASTVTGGATINLPAVASVHAGWEVVVKDESGSAATNNITIDGSGAETIEGAATKVLSTNYASARLKNTGAAWVVV